MIMIGTTPMRQPFPLAGESNEQASIDGCQLGRLLPGGLSTLGFAVDATRVLAGLLTPVRTGLAPASEDGLSNKGQHLQS